MVLSDRHQRRSEGAIVQNIFACVVTTFKRLVKVTLTVDSRGQKRRQVGERKEETGDSRDNQARKHCLWLDV